eukprot:765830-Hanusia_phi.AAC.4
MLIEGFVLGSSRDATCGRSVAELNRNQQLDRARRRTNVMLHLERSKGSASRVKVQTGLQEADESHKITGKENPSWEVAHGDITAGECPCRTKRSRRQFPAAPAPASHADMSQR